MTKRFRTEADKLRLLYWTAFWVVVAVLCVEPVATWLERVIENAG